MDWHVQYRIAEAEHVVMHATPEAAIEAACRLMDEGRDVFGIGFGSLEDSIGKKEIARIYALWGWRKRIVGTVGRSAAPKGSRGR
jgi:hypothetical protein